MPESADDTAHSTDRFAGVDTRTPEVRRLDYMADLVADMTKAVEKVIQNPGQTQRIIYKTEGMGMIGVVCATICVMTLVCLILGAILVVPELHDQRAWTDILRSKVAKLEAGQQSEKTK